MTCLLLPVTAMSLLWALTLGVSIEKGPCRGCGTPLGPVTVETPLGSMEGALWERVNGTKTAAFLGIPYAVQKRFEKSSPVSKWEGVLDATKRGPACPQGGTIPGIVLEDMSEDCLSANVFALAAGLNGSKGALRPVLFWLHGGGLTIGSAYSQALGKMFDALNIENIYDGQRMAGQGDVVVVSVNYRLGVLGFTPFGDSIGNLGFLDQQEGLRWTKKVASSFGGDPEKITIFGESAGGTSVLFHLSSPLSKDLFQQAIVESGGFDGRTLNETKQHGVEIAKKLDCSEDNILSCMKSKSYQDIIKVQGGYASMGTVGATIDSTVLPASMHDLFESGKFNKRQMIIGNNKDEASIFGGCMSVNKSEYETRVAHMYPESSAEVLKLYSADAYPHPRDAMVSLESDAIFCQANKDIADMTVKAGVPTFRYRFVRSAWFLRLMSMVSGKDAPYCVGVPHAAELIDVWGTFDALFGAESGDLKLSQHTIRAWTNFAHSGNPNSAGPMGALTPKWNAHTSQSDTTYLFDAGSTLLHPRGALKARNVLDLLADRCPVLSKGHRIEGNPAQPFVHPRSDSNVLETVLV